MVRGSRSAIRWGGFGLIVAVAALLHVRSDLPHEAVVASVCAVAVALRVPWRVPWMIGLGLPVLGAGAAATAGDDAANLFGFAFIASMTSAIVLLVLEERARGRSPAPSPDREKLSAD